MDFNRRVLRDYYTDIVAALPRTDNLSIICVNHTVANSPQFIWGLQQLGKVALVLAKGKSYEAEDRKEIEDTLRVKVEQADRKKFKKLEYSVALAKKYYPQGSRLVIADVGGYFDGSVNALAADEDVQLAGILEGTENGHKRYAMVSSDTVPIVSVARSPLKDPEDHLVGAGVVFSVEAVLRQMTQLLQGRRACVVGFGKIGAGVADALRGRGIPTSVCERDSIRRAVAAAHGFEVYSSLENGAIARSDLIISATGSRAITTAIMRSALPGTVVATVTSADDELQFDDIEDHYSKSKLFHGLDEYQPKTAGASPFFLINEGNAANFLHDAVEGPALELIYGEKVAAVAQLAAGMFEPAPKVQELSRESRKQVADIWARHFVRDA